MKEGVRRELRDIGLECPICGWPKLAASDSFCWRCSARLPEGWVHDQA